MSQLLLSVDDVRVSYGAVTALDGATVWLSDGEAIGVVGPLTAGKTTLLRTIAGMVQPERGRLRFQDRDLRGVSADSRARDGIVHVPADGGFFPSLTVHENLMLASPSEGDADALSYITQLFPVLGDRLQQRAGSLSGGEQRQLAIARGALGRPHLLLLDEPLLGLSPVTVQRVTQLLRDLLQQRVAMIIVEERPTDELNALVGRVIGMRGGRIVPAQDVENAAAAHAAATGSLERVDVEIVGVPLSTRDRRALQTIAQDTGETVGAIIGRLVHEHVEQHEEVWR